MINLSSYKLAFSDEFNSFSLFNGATGTWKPTFYYGDRTLADNAERQFYVDPTYQNLGLNPFSVRDGVLTISAQKAPDTLRPSIQNLDYTSGMINSEQAFSMQYGYFEIRAQMPAGKGLWPAFWMLPIDGSWPPELDIVEMIGQEPSSLYTTMHSQGTGKYKQTTKGTKVADMTAGFHTYGVDWGPQKIAWYFDGQKVFEADTPADMHQPMYMIANLAVGGTWPGNPDSSTTFPAQMKIDYVRAYARPADRAAVAIPSHWAAIDPKTAFSTMDGTGAIGTWDYRRVMASSEVKLKLLHDWSRYATGNDKNNYIEGSDAQYNELDGGKGNDVLKGNGGIDVFVVRNGAGNDVILDFSNKAGNADKVRLEGFHFRHFSEVQAWLKPVGGDTMLRLDEDQALLFKNVTPGQLKAEQFTFINSVPAPADVKPVPSSASPPPTTPAKPTPPKPSAPKTIVGTNGGETLKGRSGNETLLGKGGNDRLEGGAGNDILKGNAGKDVLVGGSGADAFVFDTKISKSNHKSHVDRISDFNVKDDAIWLDNAVFKKLGSKGSEASPAKLGGKHFVSGSKAKDKNDYVIYDKKKGVLLYDADGSGKGAALQVALLGKNLKMTADDFFVI